jgi:hypothetical protein
MLNQYELINIIEENKEKIWLDQNSYELFFNEVGAPNPPKEHYQYIRENDGEMIIAINKKNEILGWIGLVPKGNEYELAGIEVNIKYRNQGIGKKLMSKTKTYVINKQKPVLEFGTSPLFTSNSLLYIYENNAKYKYKNGIYIDKEKSIPWPYVECSINFSNDSESRYNIIAEPESILKWNGYTPIIDMKLLNSCSEFKYFSIRYLNSQIIMSEIRKGNTEILVACDYLFNQLMEKEYEIKNFVKYNNEYWYIYKK